MSLLNDVIYDAITNMTPNVTSTTKVTPNMTPDEKGLKRTSLRLRAELYARVEAIADAQGQSMNALIAEVLEKAFPPPQDDFISYLQLISPAERAKILNAIGVRVEESSDGSYVLFLGDRLLSSSSAGLR